MTSYNTVFGSLDKYGKGRVELINRAGGHRGYRSRSRRGESGVPEMEPDGGVGLRPQM